MNRSRITLMFVIVAMLPAICAAQPGGPPQPAPAPAQAPAGGPPPVAGPVQEFGVYNVRQLVALGTESNPVLRRAMEKIESARGDVVQASLYPNPRMETNNPELFAGKQSAINFGIQQDIIVKGKMRLNRAIANQSVEMNKSSFVLDRMNVMTAIRRQAYIAIAAERRVEVLRELAGIAGRGRDTAAKLEKAGEGTLTDTLLTTTEMERAYVAYRTAVTLADAEHRKLASIMGTPDIEIKDVQGDLLDPIPDFNEDIVRAFVATQSAQVRMAEADIAKQQYVQRRAEVDPYPDIRCGPSFQNGVVENTSQGWFTVAFFVPMWDRNQGNIRQARADVRASRANREAVQNDLLTIANDLLGDHYAARERAHRYHKVILPNAFRTRQLVEDGYLKGEFDLTRLLQAQRTLTETNVDFIDALKEVWTTAAELAGMLQVEEFP